MSIKTSNSLNKTMVFILVTLIAILVVMVFGSSDWIRSVHANQSLGINSWCWTQIIISIALGFGLGWVVFKKH